MNHVMAHGRTAAVMVLILLGVLVAAGAARQQPVAKTVAFSPLAVDTAVVVVHVRRHTGSNAALAQTGTGVVLTDGRVLTATHLFKEAWNDVEIVFGGRAGRSEQAVLWKGEPTHIGDRDVTMLSDVRVPAWVKPVKVSKRAAAKGDSVVSFGLSRPSRPRLRGGVIDELQRSGGIVIDVNSSQGDSGGPTFNQNNELVGIHTGVMTRTWEGKWGKRADVFSLSARVTDLKELVKDEKVLKKP